MSDFPSFPHDVSSSRQPSDGTLVDYGDDGTARVRIMYEATQWIFNLNLKQLTSSDVTSLLDHYGAHKAVNFSYVWPEDSASYLCAYIGHPEPAVSAAVGRYDYTVKLVGVAS